LLIEFYMHFIVVVRIKHDISIIYFQIKQVQIWIRQRFTIKSRKSLNEKARNKYNCVENANLLFYKKRLSNQDNTIEFSNSEYEQICENIWSKQKIKK